jgi:hypothetical protein
MHLASPEICEVYVLFLAGNGRQAAHFPRIIQFGGHGVYQKSVDLAEYSSVYGSEAGIFPD